MCDVFSTGSATKVSGRTTHIVGRTINVLFGPSDLRPFGPRNALAVTNVLKSALSRCNSAFRSQAECERHVESNFCLNISPYNLIAGCQEEAKIALCRDICTTDQKSAVSVIRSLPGIINGSLYKRPVSRAPRRLASVPFRHDAFAHRGDRGPRLAPGHAA